MWQFKKIRIRSKNRRMFIYTALFMLLMMVLFFMANTVPLNPKYYIAFAFVWLGTIVGVCMMYLVPRGKSRMRQTMMTGIGFYGVVNFLLNVGLVNLISIRTLVVVDFFITFGILMLGITLYLLGKQSD